MERGDDAGFPDIVAVLDGKPERLGIQQQPHVTDVAQVVGGDCRGSKSPALIRAHQALLHQPAQSLPQRAARESMLALQVFDLQLAAWWDIAPQYHPSKRGERLVRNGRD